jgi:hypothetical protein
MKKIFFVILSVLCGASVQACDVCGCALGGGYMGLLPEFDRNFVGLRWSQAKFNAYMNHHSEYFQNEYSHDTYNKVELWGRFKLGKRFQMFAFVPYSYNDMNGSVQKVTTHGLGDISLLGNFRVLRTMNEEARFQHSWMVAGGVKLPTGKYDLQDNGMLVNPNFQLGTGSVDFILNTSYQVTRGKIGAYFETGYKINTRNKEDYLFGNQFYLSTNVLYTIKAGEFTFLPNAGLFYEHADQHKDGEVIITNTGGNALFLSSGVETYYKKISFGVNYKSPLAQNYNSDSIADIEARGRWMLNVTYSF